MPVTGTIYDVMANLEMVPDVQITHFGVFLFLFFQAIILSLHFFQSLDRAEDAEAKVRDLNENLENQVKDRTKTIRTILDNVNSGLLLVNSQGELQTGFSKSCAEIFRKNLKSNQNLVDQLNIPMRLREHLQASLEQVFFSMMPPRVSLDQIPNRLSIWGSDAILLRFGSLK